MKLLADMARILKTGSKKENLFKFTETAFIQDKVDRAGK